MIGRSKRCHVSAESAMTTASVITSTPRRHRAPIGSERQDDRQVPQVDAVAHVPQIVERRSSQKRVRSGSCAARSTRAPNVSASPVRQKMTMPAFVQ